MNESNLSLGEATPKLQQKPYKRPELQELGYVSELTASGSQGTQTEEGNSMQNPSKMKV